MENKTAELDKAHLANQELDRDFGEDEYEEDDDNDEYYEEETEFIPPVLTGMEAKTFAELEAEAPTNPKVQEYLESFHESVKNALRGNTTPTGALPFRGAMTLGNLPHLFILMPDLYEYLGCCYGAIESSGDVIINDILDAANTCDYNIIKKHWRRAL